MSVEVDECEVRLLPLEDPREEPREDSGEPELDREPGEAFFVAGGLDLSESSEIDGVFETDTTEKDFSL